MTKDKIRKKRGNVYAFIGLCLGIAIGLGILRLKQYIAQELITLLADEVRDSVPCTLKYDQIDISLLRLHAEAIGTRLECSGSVALKFENIRAQFSLWQIRDRTVQIDNIDLVEGYADGVGPDSVTYQFIDHLTTPIPPEKDRPDRWRVKLMKLDVSAANFIERFPDAELLGSNTKLSVSRDEKDNFWLIPFVEKLTLRLGTSDPSLKPTEWWLGAATTKLYLTGDDAIFNDFLLSADKNRLAGQFVDHPDLGNTLTGSHHLSLDLSSLFRTDIVSGTILGQGEVTGLLGQPIIFGNLNLPPQSGLNLPGLVSLYSLEGAYKASLKDNIPSLTINSLKVSGQDISGELNQKVFISPSTASGAFLLKAEELNWGDLKAEDANLAFHFSGTGGEPEINLNGHLGALIAGALHLPNVNIQAQHSGKNLNLELFHTSAEIGDFDASAKLVIGSPLASTQIKEAEFELESLQLSQVIPSLGALKGASVSAHGGFNGTVDPQSLTGMADMKLQMPGQLGGALLAGNLALKNGSVLINLADPQQTFRSAVSLPLVPQILANIKIDLNGFRPKIGGVETECAALSGQFNYGFYVNSPARGDGLFQASDIRLGCAPAEIALQNAANIKIQKGTFEIEDLRFASAESDITVKGQVTPESGLLIDIYGTLQLSALLPLFPKLDEFSGLLDTSIKVRGNWEHPEITGQATITEGDIVNEAGNIDINGLSGKLQLSGDKISLDNLKGSINGGVLILSGYVYPIEPERSNLNLETKGVMIEPMPDVSIIFSSKLSLGRMGSGDAGLTGKVTIDSATFQRNLDFREILASLSSYVFSRPAASIALQTNQMPAIKLDISVEATRNIFLNTNFAVAELKSDLTIGDTLTNPSIRGRLETISGWFGLKDKRFDITSGTLSFRAASAEPYLEMLGETIIPSRQGDNVLVLAEIKGPFSNAKLSLTSDRGLSDRELLNLVTSGASTFGLTARAATARDLAGGNELLEDESLFSLPSFFRRLTRLQNLSVQPAYNIQSGLIEPSVAAQKQLTDDIAVVAESFFGSSANDSKVSMIYDLNSSLRASVSAESISSRSTTALGADLTYTVLARQKQFIDIDITGNDKFSSDRLLRSLRIGGSSRLEPLDIPKLEESVREIYLSAGYHAASARVTCVNTGKYCHTLKIHVSEGEISSVDKIIFTGDTVPPEIRLADLSEVSSRLKATQQTLNSRRSTILRRLRAEGYIAARVSAQYEPSDNPSSQSLVINVRPGRPVTFTFEGNTKYSAEDFLETINLFNRRQPFGNNTITILVENIERLYREAGYLYASIVYERLSVGETNRVNYLIKIEENERVLVSEVTWQGLSYFSQESLRTEIRARQPQVEPVIFSPNYAIAEEINSGRGLIKQIYSEHGFPYASIDFSIATSKDNTDATITYNVAEGQSVSASELKIENLPEDVLAPTPPADPISVPRLNLYVETLLEVLRAEGYFNAAIQVSPDFEKRIAVVSVSPGQRSYVAKVQLGGLVNIKRSVVRRAMAIRKGDPITEAAISTTRRRLLRSGLFSRVEVQAADGTFDDLEETLVIRVWERALQTLELGTGLNSEYGVHFFADATDHKLFRDGKSLGLRVDSYFNQDSGEVEQGIMGLRYADPAFAGSEFSFSEDLRYQRLDLSTQEFDVSKVSLSTFFYRTFEDSLSLALGHTLAEEDVKNVSPDAILSDLDSGIVRLSSLNGSLTYDLRDSALTPRKGHNYTFDYRLATEAIGSDANYGGLGGRAAVVQPLHGALQRFSIAASTRLSSLWTFGGTSEVPITERFYLGGRNSIRGFRENSLGPRGDEGSIIGGDTLNANNLELRYLMTDETTIHLFLDAGTVWLRSLSFSFDDIRYSTGIGFRYLSPIGPIGFDIGAPLDERSGEPSLRFHFNIGSNF